MPSFRSTMALLLVDFSSMALKIFSRRSVVFRVTPVVHTESSGRRGAGALPKGDRSVEYWNF